MGRRKYFEERLNCAATSPTGQCCGVMGSQRGYILCDNCGSRGRIGDFSRINCVDW